jgi:hypothetical protein
METLQTAFQCHTIIVALNDLLKQQTLSCQAVWNMDYISNQL